MDDQVQNPIIQSNQNVNNDQTSSQSQQQQQPTQTPVSFSPNKESAPVLVSDKELNLHPEVEAAGVEVVSDNPKLDKVHEKIGVKLSGASIPVQTEPTGAVSLPMSKQEAVTAEKGKDDDSGTWLGTLLAKIYRRLGALSLREVKG